jgi:hypothetical protein
MQLADAPGTRLRRAVQLAGRPVTLLRRHWLLTALLGAGLVLRVLAMIAYRPALLYIDSLKYLYNAWPSTDPVGYKVPLQLILAVGSLQTVVGIQHLLGLAMAATIYVMLLRRDVPRWLAAGATAPVLLDAYQVQMEQMIMPDVWFEALIVAGVAVLLWRPQVTLWAAVSAGLLLGATATVREVGAILILPALLYTVVTSGGWRKGVQAASALTAAFAVPIVLYGSLSYVSNGHFRLSRTVTSQAYGRLALAADCATLRTPPYQRGLCPPERQKLLLGADGLDHSASSPIAAYHAPPGMNRSAVIASFCHTVLLQQPLNVAGSIARDAVKLFALTRDASPGDPPISRWQFQTGYPTYGRLAERNVFRPIISVDKDGLIVVALNNSGSVTGPYVYRTLSPSLGGRAAVNQSLSNFLRSYQLEGGYTPGPVFAFAALAGLLGSLSLLWRSAGSRSQTDPDHGCLLVFTVAAAILLASDFFEFSWRYQLPALVTLAPAGALGVMVIRRRLAAGTHWAPVHDPDAIQPGERQDPPEPSCYPEATLSWGNRSKQPLDRGQGLCDGVAEPGPYQGASKPKPSRGTGQSGSM